MPAPDVFRSVSNGTDEGTAASHGPERQSTAAVLSPREPRYDGSHKLHRYDCDVRGSFTPVAVSSVDNLPAYFHERRPMRGKSRYSLCLGTLVVVGVAAIVGIVVLSTNGQGNPLGTPFRGDRAYQHLKDICALGGRVSGSNGMAQQQKLLIDHFEQLGGRVSRQEFDARHPEDGSTVKMANLVVEWHPERSDRILLCAHYDTRPFPDNDPDPAKRRGLFVGANDGASGTAVLCELARFMPSLDSRYGVDFVLFDGEELVFDNARDPYFLGSKHFARIYAAGEIEPTYHYGVLLDMVGDREISLYYERNSMKHARDVVIDVWKAARRLNARTFKHRSKHTVNDDHVPLNEIAKIPTIDIVDFDYPRPGRLNYWHTTMDVPEMCSADSLGIVGAVVLEWLSHVEDTLPPRKN